MMSEKQESSAVTQKKKKRKSGTKIDLPAPAAEIQTILEKTNSTFHGKLLRLFLPKSSST